MIFLLHGSKLAPVNQEQGPNGRGYAVPTFRDGTADHRPKSPSLVIFEAS